MTVLALQKPWLCIAIVVLALASGLNPARAQSLEANAPSEPSDPASRLESLHSNILNKQEQLQTLQDSVATQTTPAPDLLEDIESLRADINSLQNTFNQLAAGGIELVEIATEDAEFDWRQELILVTQPILENLKGLTEKPRKIERLKSIIEQRESEATDITDALARISTSLADHSDSPTRTPLQTLKENWEQRESDNEQALELARYQLSTLLGDNTPKLETVKKLVMDFLQGRGLTLALVVLVSLMLWLLSRGLLRLLLRKKGQTRVRSRQASHRLASYGYSFFTSMLILIGVMVVLYIRGDLLLLALAIIVIASMALSLRTILPQFMSEARLLLNIGAIREGERVIHNGLALEVQSINVHSYLRNPALEGVVRLPLSHLKDMTSRPTNDETWFPTEPGDVLLMPDGGISKVLQQTTEFVELQSRTGPLQYYTTTDFMSLEFENLTRSEEFTIVTYFGVDYELQSSCLDLVPIELRRSIEEAFKRSRFAEHVKTIKVDFHNAATSSLDYIIFIQADSEIAISRYAIERIAQQACVSVCNQNNWSIPFKQLVVHQGQAA